MLRDIEIGAPIEADHILGDLLLRGGDKSEGGSLLRVAFTHVKAYEGRRSRSQAAETKTA
jgi:2-dehydropantoate 2-reductase